MFQVERNGRVFSVLQGPPFAIFRLASGLPMHRREEGHNEMVKLEPQSSTPSEASLYLGGAVGASTAVPAPPRGHALECRLCL